MSARGPEYNPEDRAAVEQILCPCNCLDDYKLRGLVDPTCVFCHFGEDVLELIRDRDNLRRINAMLAKSLSVAEAAELKELKDTTRMRIGR